MSAGQGWGALCRLAACAPGPKISWILKGSRVNQGLVGVTNNINTNKRTGPLLGTYFFQVAWMEGTQRKSFIIFSS